MNKQLTENAGTIFYGKHDELAKTLLTVDENFRFTQGISNQNQLCLTSCLTLVCRNNFHITKVFLDAKSNFINVQTDLSAEHTELPAAG